MNNRRKNYGIILEREAAHSIKLQGTFYEIFD
jgi:hypothetical protein